MIGFDLEGNVMGGPGSLGDEGASPLVFSELDYELYPEESQLVVFPSQLQHGVPSQRGEGRRMVISGNIIAQYD